MVTLIVLWVLNLGQPMMIGKWTVDVPSPTLQAREEMLKMNDCETAAMSLRRIGVRAWCVPVMQF